MNLTRSPTGGRLAKMRKYRRLMFGVLLGGVTISLVLRFLEFPLVGEAVYLVGFAAFLAIWQGTSITLFDERETELERRAATVTLTVTAFVLIFSASGARVFHAITGSSVPPWLHYAIYGFIAQFVLFAIVYTWYRYRQ